MHSFVSGLRKGKEYWETRVFRHLEARFLVAVLLPCCLFLAWCLYQFSLSWFLVSCCIPLLAWHLWVCHPRLIPLPKVARIIDSEYRMRDLIASAHEFQNAEVQNPLVAGLLQQADTETSRLQFADEFRRQKLVSRLLWILFLLLIIANLLALLPWGKILSSSAKSGGSTSENGSEESEGKGTSSNPGGEEPGGEEGDNPGKGNGSEAGSDGKDGKDGKEGKNGESGTGKGSNGSKSGGKEGQGEGQGKGTKGDGKNQKDGSGGSSPGASASKQALASLGEGLQKNPSTSALGKALQKQDLPGGSREADKLSKDKSSSPTEAAKQAKSLAQAAQKALEQGGEKADPGVQKALKQMAASGNSPEGQKQALQKLAQALKKLGDEQKGAGQEGKQPGSGSGSSPTPPKPGESKNGQGAGGKGAGGKLDEDPLNRMNQKRPAQAGDERLIDPEMKRQLAASAAQRLGAYEGKPELTPEQQRQRQATVQKAANSRKIDDFAQRHRIPDQFRTYLKDFFSR